MLDPRQRLGSYCSRGLLEMWDTALEPFFAMRLRMAPELGDSAKVRGEGIERGRHKIRAELRAINCSTLVGPDRMSHPLQPSEWSLTYIVLVKGAFVYIDDLLVRPVEPETARSMTETGALKPGPARSNAAAVINPFALLSAVPANRPAGDLPPPLPILPNPLVHAADPAREHPGTGEDGNITTIGEDTQERTLREAAGRGDADAAYLLGDSLLARGLPEQAHLWYRTAADTVYARALFNLAVVLESRGRLDDAAALYRQAGQAGHVDAMKNLVTLLRDQGDTEEAEQWSRHVVQDRRNQILPSPLRSVHENAGSRAASPAIDGTGIPVRLERDSTDPPE
jgi:hypothetical protein